MVNNTKVRIEILSEKKLIGMSMEMNLTINKTIDLWQKFMPRRHEVSNNISNDVISLQFYPTNYFLNFDLTRKFQKWATLEVESFVNIPHEMESITLQGGLYAVFEYKGASTDNSIFQYIFGTWLPSSEYELDDRPHFEILGDKYNNNDPESEEEIWIPIRLK